MQEDSVFSHKPGTCPKCGMDLVKVEKKILYACPMHPEIESDKPGTCPICGMDLEPLETQGEVDTLSVLVQPTNQRVLSSLKPIVPSLHQGKNHLAVKGYLTYDPNKTQSFSARVSGRVERLWVRSNYQQVAKGEKLLELYSPELQTAQQEYLYLLKSHDGTDTSLRRTLRERLLLLGMEKREVTQLEKTGKVQPYVTLYSPSSGHVHFLNGNVDIASHGIGFPNTTGSMAQEDTKVLREGDYVAKGELLFAIADQSQIWALLKITSSDRAFVKQGQSVALWVNGTQHRGNVDFIEKSFEDFYTARVVLPCRDHRQLKIGELVEGTISLNGTHEQHVWVPRSAVLYLGQAQSAVFLKKELGFEAKTVGIGSRTPDWVEITDGLSLQDSLAPIASYLVDSDAFIETK